MGKMKRLGAFTLISFIGFLIGIVANLICFQALPILQQIFPQILGMTWVIWGLTGTFLSVAGCLVYTVFNVSKRLEILGLMAISGFLMGVIANFLYFYGLPILVTLFPQIFNVTWIIWGIMGALISAIGCLIYAYLT